MLQLIAFIIFIGSLGGIVYLLYKKIPVLIHLPEQGHHGFKKPASFVKAEKRFRDLHFHFFKKQMLLHRFLSKTKIYILKAETKIDTLLSGIRKRAQELDKKGKRK